jgi:HK97 family phage major capsid protein
MSANLRDKRAALVQEWRGVLDKAEAEGRALNADEKTKIQKIETEIDDLKATIDARERADAIDRTIVPESQRAAETAAARPHADGAQTAYRDAFWKAMRSGVMSAELRDHKVGTDSAGGYLVPDAFRAELITALNEENIMRRYAQVFTTTSGIMSIPVNSAHGSASWKSEEAAYSTSDETFSEVTLSAYKGTALIKVSEELLNDSAFPIESFLAKEFGRRLGKLEEEAFINGSGSGQPTGLFGGSTLGTTAAATNAITADELTDLYHSLGRAYRSRAVFVMADSTFKLIRKLKTGVSGDNTYLWQAGLAAGEPDTLFGRPVLVSEFAPAATTGLKAIVFGDLSYYYIGDRQAMSMQRLNELYAANGQVGFRQFKRTDGKLALATAAYHLKLA